MIRRATSTMNYCLMWPCGPISDANGDLGSVHSYRRKSDRHARGDLLFGGAQRLCHRRHAGLAGTRASAGPAAGAACGRKLDRNQHLLRAFPGRVFRRQNTSVRPAVERIADVCARARGGDSYVRGDAATPRGTTTASYSLGSGDCTGGSRWKARDAGSGDALARALFQRGAQLGRRRLGGFSHLVYGASCDGRGCHRTGGTRDRCFDDSIRSARNRALISWHRRSDCIARSCRASARHALRFQPEQRLASREPLGDSKLVISFFQRDRRVHPARS